MQSILRDLAATPRLEHHVAMDALCRALSPAVIDQALTQHHAHAQRRRKLPAAVTLLLCIALALWAHEAVPAVFRQLVAGLRWRWPSPLRVSPSALCQARYRLGPGPLVTLFHTLCRPLATPTTPGAFHHGLHLVAVDATKLDVPDTPANARAFGRPGVARGQAPWPQVLVVGLLECATHALLDAGVWPVTGNERAAAQRLLRALPAAALLLYDAGLHSVDLVANVRQHGAHVLGCLPGHVRPRLLRVLPDGSALVHLRPSSRTHTVVAEPLRLLCYTLDDPARPGAHTEHRLLTSLLDPIADPALDLILLYHQRWEFELVLDEQFVHQHPHRPLRSQRPLGVLQECYALFLAHSLLRALMVEAAAPTGLSPTRLSFLETLRLVRLALPDLQRAGPRQRHWLRQALLADIAAAVLPPRRDRLNPRVVKRAQSPFRVKRPQHRPSPRPTKPLREAIVLLN